jgi:antiviral helicase SKI2
MNVDSAFAAIDAAIASQAAPRDKAPKAHDFSISLRELGVNSHFAVRETPSSDASTTTTTTTTNLSHLLLSTLSDSAAIAPKSRRAHHAAHLRRELLNDDDDQNFDGEATWPRTCAPLSELALLPAVPPISRIEVSAASRDAWHERLSVGAQAHGDADNSTSTLRAPSALTIFSAGPVRMCPFCPVDSSRPRRLSPTPVCSRPPRPLLPVSRSWCSRRISCSLSRLACGAVSLLAIRRAATMQRMPTLSSDLPPLAVPNVAQVLGASALALDQDAESSTTVAAAAAAAATTTGRKVDFDDNDAMFDIDSKSPAASSSNSTTTKTTTTRVTGSSLDTALDALVGTAEAARLRERRIDARRTEYKWASVDTTDTSKFHEAVPTMAIEYGFELDHFQKAAVMHIEKGENVLVAAHTSAGKTVVAEYAIALSAKRLTRALYTSPIKALSNQKFRDFRTTFGDNNVGIITGDISLNPEAPCLILTTEILRSMLYKGADLIRDVEWVIFDEIHYINDLERGVVWEEVIIMLPEHVNVVFLSATIPNALEFSEWIGRTKQRHVYVVSTNKRPVPLEHHLYTSNNELFLVRDRDGNFLSKNVAAATKSHKDKIDAEKLKAKAKGQAPGYIDHHPKPQWTGLLRHLEREQLLPCVVFHFSKKKCEEVADALGANTLLLSADERRQVSAFFGHCVARLKPNDRKLQQVRRLAQLLDRGIGVHHGGLLPLMKEAVEMLFARNLVKVLFATETFAMGVNMPARCVVFGQTRKHDGRELRNLQPGEYTQMAGRAGRRGLDETGTVLITAWGEPPGADELRGMLCGTSMVLSSQFRLTYNMILNLLRVADFNVQEMMRRSFGEFHSQRLLPQQEEELAQAEADVERLAAFQCGGRGCSAAAVDEFYQEAAELAALERAAMRHALDNSPRLKSLIGAGRLLVCRFQASRYGMWQRRTGIALTAVEGAAAAAAPSSAAASSSSSSTTTPSESVRVLFLTFDDAGREAGQVTRVEASDIIGVSHNSVKLKSVISITTGDRRAIAEAVQQLSVAMASTSSGEPPLLDLVQDAKVLDLDHADRVALIRRLTSRLAAAPCRQCSELEAHFELMRKRDELQRRVRELKHALSANALALMPDFEKRVQVLQVLNYVDGNRTVQLKGRVAREINTSDELILTELLFSNIFADMSPAEAVALLSCFVFQEKVDASPRLTSGLSDICERVKGDCDVAAAPAAGLRRGARPGRVCRAVQHGPDRGGLRVGVADAVC